MGSKNKRFQAMHHSGETGKVTSASRFSTAATASKVTRAKRQELPVGSSD